LLYLVLKITLWVPWRFFSSAPKPLSSAHSSWMTSR
jgi:hypothetical protein